VNWLRENTHWLLFAGLVLTGLGTVGVAVVGVVATLSTLLTGGSLVATVGTFLLGTLTLGGLTVVFAVALLATLARLASSAASDVSFPTSQRAADACHRIERVVPPLAGFGLGDRFEPSVEERRAELTERYVAGELTEAELESELAALLDGQPETGVTDPVGNIDRETVTTDDTEAPTDHEVETET